MKGLIATGLFIGFVLPAVPALAGPCAHSHEYRSEWGHGGDLGHVHPERGCHGANARADQQRTHGCSFTAITDQIAGQGQMTGEIDIAAVVHSESLAENPVAATITCYVTVNGVRQGGASVSASGTAVVAGGGVVTYNSASVTDDVQLCQDTRYSTGETTSECFEADTFEIPPDIL